MALSNLSGWAGSSCGASDKPAACGASDKPAETPALSPGKARPLPGDFPNTIGFGRFSYEGNMI